MDVVLVGLPGTGKSEVGRRLAEALGATFVDTDREVERRAGRTIADVFATDGEAAFRAMDRAVVAGLSDGGRSGAPGKRRVIATGGGTIVDPRNRWALFHGRAVAWLDAPTRLLAERLGRSPVVRPLLAGDPEGALERLRADRGRFYAAGTGFDASGPVGQTVAAIQAWLAGDAATAAAGTALLRADLGIGRVVLGDGIAAAAVDDELRRAGARRAVILTEPRAWTAVGEPIRRELGSRGWALDVVQLPEGEDAKRLAIVERAANALADLGLERAEPIVAIGGGALTDVAGFIAATYGRGVPWIAVPTTLLGQLDAAHGGKTAVDVAAGKNLVGAFHLPRAVVVDTALLATLPERHRRSALAEAVKDGALADPRLLEVLDAHGAAVARADETEAAALAEIVERAMWVKLGFVADDPDEHGNRIALNLGHTLGHAIEAAAGFGPVLHGEAVAYGLRAAVRIGEVVGATPPDLADRLEGLLDRLGLAIEPLDLEAEDIVRRLSTDKKRHGRATRWVLPTAGGWTVRSDVALETVDDVARHVLAGRPARVTA